MARVRVRCRKRPAVRPQLRGQCRGRVLEQLRHDPAQAHQCNGALGCPTTFAADPPRVETLAGEHMHR